MSKQIDRVKIIDRFFAFCSPVELDQLQSIIRHGVVEDGDLISKDAARSLYEGHLIVRYEGKSYPTKLGLCYISKLKELMVLLDDICCWWKTGEILISEARRKQFRARR